MIKKQIVLPKPKEGSISQRKCDGRFMGIYRDKNGKRKYVYDYTYHHCLQKMNDAILYRNMGIERIKLFDWLEKFVELYKKPNVAPETYKAYKGYINNYFKCKNPKITLNYRLLNVDITECRGDTLQEFLLAIEKERTRESIHDLLTGAFRKAYALGYVERNPVLAVEIPTHKRVIGSYCSDDILRSFFDALREYKYKNADLNVDNLADYYKLLLYSGCRRSEGLRVRKDDFNFENCLYHIRGTKTEGSDRYIPLFDEVEEIARRNKNNLMFDYHADFVTKLFSELCPGHTLKDLRKTFATNCRRAGVPIDVVQAWLGHTQIETTRHHYVEVLPEMHRQYAEKLSLYRLTTMTKN